jgi:hypothetical protein
MSDDAAWSNIRRTYNVRTWLNPRSVADENRPVAQHGTVHNLALDGLPATDEFRNKIRYSTNSIPWTLKAVKELPLVAIDQREELVYR